MEIIKVIEESGVEQQTALTLKESFLPFFEKAQEWAEKAKTLVVTDITQTREMRMAKEARLALRDIRIEADKKRKALKEDSLRYGKAVQGVYNVIEYLIVPIEKHLEDQEKFIQIQEAKRIELLKNEREEELRPFAEFVPFNLNLGMLSNEDYQKTLNGAKLQFQEKIDAERKAEKERNKKEKEEAEERERIRLENEKMKKEAEKREKELKAEMEKIAKEKLEAEKKLQKEREEAQRKLNEERKQREQLAAKIEADRITKEKAEKELQEKAAKEMKEKLEAEKKLAAAPDVEKLKLWAYEISKISVPDLKTESAKVLAVNVSELLVRVSNYILNNLEKIN